MEISLQLLQVFLVLIQFIFLIFGYNLTIKHFKMSKSSDFLERFLSKEMIESRSCVDRVFEQNDLKSALEYLYRPENIDDLNKVRSFANFFQELSIAKKMNLVSDKYVKDTFDYLVCKYWSLLSGWISDYRSKSDSTLYSKWEDLRDDFRNNNNELKKL